jgi:membrane protein
MAFYHFLAIFPSLLVVLAAGGRIPHLGEAMENGFQDLARQVFPDRVSELFHVMTGELGSRTLSGRQSLFASAGALWAMCNATWAMIYGLNRAYEVEERRSWWKLAMTIAGLTVSLGATGFVTLSLIFFCAWIEGATHLGGAFLRGLEWSVLVAALYLSFAVLYRFAPDTRERKWQWSTPGALCALVLWMGATFAARFYFDHLDDYSRSYGRLNGVVMLLLWLYVISGAILIGGEMNSEIEKAAGKREVRRDR